MTSLENFNRRPAGPAFSQPDAFFDLFYLFAGDPALDSDDVRLRQLVSRMRQTIGQLAVIGKNNDSRRIGVQPAHTEDTLRTMDQIDRLFPALGIAIRADHAPRLIQQKIDLSDRANRFTVYGDNVLIRIDKGR